MAEIHIVCVHQDQASAETLAELFGGAGFSVAGAPRGQNELQACIASVLLVSGASLRSTSFVDAARRVVAADKALIASLLPLPSDLDLAYPAFDLTKWDGDLDDPEIDPLVFAVNNLAVASRDKDARGHDIDTLGGAAEVGRFCTQIEKDGKSRGSGRNCDVPAALPQTKGDARRSTREAPFVCGPALEPTRPRETKRGWWRLITLRTARGSDHGHTLAGIFPALVTATAIALCATVAVGGFVPSVEQGPVRPLQVHLLGGVTTAAANRASDNVAPTHDATGAANRRGGPSVHRVSPVLPATLAFRRPEPAADAVSLSLDPALQRSTPPGTPNPAAQWQPGAGT